MDLSLDLGISRTRIDVSDPIWDTEKLEKIVKDPDSIYFIRDGETYKAALSMGHFYKLHPTGPTSAPALLIDGVLMHRVKDIDPIEDASMKAELCARKGIDMLEICTGLGYSTIACLRRGVKSIVTIEKDPSVIELARLNPWSRDLFADKRVSTVQGDASKKIEEFDDCTFHSVMHDPPRFSMGSELYTSEFYSQLYRVLKPKGVLFHYVGSPGSKHRKRDLQKGILTRLREVGFKQVKRNESTLGVVARKERVGSKEK
ncbi:MAG: class I SAM-dependent methyltransferase [Candidatus Thorarchaeota archaeon]